MFYYFNGLNILSRREFVTTVMELNAIAAAAMIGFKKPWSPRMNLRPDGTFPFLNAKYSTPAATGMRIQL
jgi:hypothetical protein